MDKGEKRFRTRVWKDNYLGKDIWNDIEANYNEFMAVQKYRDLICKDDFGSFGSFQNFNEYLEMLEEQQYYNYKLRRDQERGYFDE